MKRWFQGLEADNSREYFAAHRDVFEEAVRDQMEALLTELERYRDAVADDARGPELAKLLAKAQKAGLEVWGESLATAPVTGWLDREVGATTLEMRRGRRR